MPIWFFGRIRILFIQNHFLKFASEFIDSLSWWISKQTNESTKRNQETAERNHKKWGKENIEEEFRLMWQLTTLFQTEKYIVRISCGWNQGISLKMEDSTAAPEGTTEKQGTGIFYTCFNKKWFKSCGSFVILFRWRQLEGWIGSLYQWCF